ncbi:hypothetical protein ONO86_02630 [Micromonospora noduli]|nr:hypothetical protein ONO86_02630 [Micromonospora noduli]
MTESGRIVIGGESWEAPTFENGEHFVRRLQDAGLLVRSHLGDEEQIAEHPEASPTVETLRYFDQAHLAHALRRYVGCTARELQAGHFAAMSFLYKTHPGPGS